MRFEFSPQYNRACAVIEEGDSYATVVQHPDISNCFYNDGLERLVCVRFPGFQQGLYTREALRGLMGGQATERQSEIPDVTADYGWGCPNCGREHVIVRSELGNQHQCYDCGLRVYVKPGRDHTTARNEA